MFSIADMAVAGAVALLLFGPDQLPKVARRAGQLVRDVQNTSQSFIREMERAADHDSASADAAAPYAGPAYPATLEMPAVPGYHETPEPAPHELVVKEAALGPHPGDTVSPASGPPHTSAAAPPAPAALGDAARPVHASGALLPDPNPPGARNFGPPIQAVAPVADGALPGVHDAVPGVHDAVAVVHDAGPTLAGPASHSGQPAP